MSSRSPSGSCITTSGGTARAIRTASAGDQIPLGARIIFVADAFDAMTLAEASTAAAYQRGELAEPSAEPARSSTDASSPLPRGAARVAISFLVCRPTVTSRARPLALTRACGRAATSPGGAPVSGAGLAGDHGCSRITDAGLERDVAVLAAGPRLGLVSAVSSASISTGRVRRGSITSST